MPYVYSTLTNDQMYTEWHPVTEGLEHQRRQVKHAIHIKGGANMADKRGDTVLGVCTHVTEEELKVLEGIHDFQRHKANKFIVVRDRKVDPEVVSASGMKSRDESAPYTPETVHEELPKETVNKKTGETEITGITVKTTGSEATPDFQKQIDRD